MHISSNLVDDEFMARREHVRHCTRKLKWHKFLKEGGEIKETLSIGIDS